MPTLSDRGTDVDTPTAVAGLAGNEKSTSGEAKAAGPADGVALGADAAESAELTPEERTKRGDRIIQDHVLLAVVAGFIPGPALDMAAAFADQLVMIKRLSSLYGVPFRENLAKGVLSSFLTSVGGVGAGAVAAMSALKLIPLIGTAVGVAGTSISLGAFTYGVGKVFQAHFAAGGTLIDLDPRAYRDYFREMTKRGKNVAKESLRSANNGGEAAALPAGEAVGSA
jgi:uncharacterized protein (DUF697 family)